MIAIKTTWFPFNGYRAITLWPFIFYKGVLTEKVEIHERIHLRQQTEWLLIPFYIKYLIEFFSKGYRNISFEREAYQNSNKEYLKKHWKLFYSYNK